MKCSGVGLQFSGLRLKIGRQADFHPTLLIAQKTVFSNSVSWFERHPLVKIILSFILI